MVLKMIKNVYTITLNKLKYPFCHKKQDDKKASITLSSLVYYKVRIAIIIISIVTIIYTISGTSELWKGFPKMIISHA